MNIIDILRQQSQFLHVYGKRWWTMAKLSFPIMIFQITNSLNKWEHHKGHVGYTSCNYVS